MPSRNGRAIPPEYRDRILVGDALETLRSLPDAIAATCVTSPPYWSLRDYGVPGQSGLEPTPEDYVDRLVRVFRELRRVLRTDGTLWLNLGDTYYTGAGRVKNPGGAAHDLHPRGLPPNRTPGHPILKPKDMSGIPWRVAFALQEDGWYLRNAIVYHRTNGVPSSVRDRLRCSYDFLFLLARLPSYYFDLDAIREPHTSPWLLKSRRSDFSRTRRREDPAAHLMRAPPSNTDYLRKKTARPHRLTGYRLAPEPGEPHAFNPRGKNPGDVWLGDVWSMAAARYKGAHYAVFPEQLVERPILAGSPPGGLVLDPFCGSGTTLAVAKRLGRHYLGIDLNPEYVELARNRIAAEPQGPAARS